MRFDSAINDASEIGESLLRREIRKSRADDVPTKDGLGFEDLIERVRQDRDARRRRCNDIDQRLKHLWPFFRRMRAGRISTETVERYVDLRLSEKAAPATINRELALLRRAIVLARLTKRPLIPSLPENNARHGFLEWADFRRIREKLPSDFRDIATFLYLSGRPQGQVAALEWRDIDMERCEMVRDESEGVRKIPLSGELWSIVQQAHAARLPNCPFVFHREGEPFHLRGSKSPLRKAWARACEAAGFGGHVLHCLRRSGVRNMIGEGVDQMTALKVSGFKTMATLAEVDQDL